MSIRIGFVLLVLAVLAGLFGYQFSHPGVFDARALAADFYPGLSSTLLLAAITIVVIGGMYEQRDNRRARTALIEQMRSRDNQLALRAVERIRERGWLAGGGLQGAKLAGANLNGAYLWGADLQGANLEDATLDEGWLAGANLRGAYLKGVTLRGATLQASNMTGTFLAGANLSQANLRDANLDRANVNDAQLANAARLRNASMPDGRPYDGRFNLLGDLNDARAAGISPEDPASMAHFYGVTPHVYRRGQAWAEANLERGAPGREDETSDLSDDSFSTRALPGYGPP